MEANYILFLFGTISVFIFLIIFGIITKWVYRRVSQRLRSSIKVAKEEFDEKFDSMNRRMNFIENNMKDRFKQLECDHPNTTIGSKNDPPFGRKHFEKCIHCGKITQSFSTYESLYKRQMDLNNKEFLHLRKKLIEVRKRKEEKNDG